MKKRHYTISLLAVLLVIAGLAISGFSQSDTPDASGDSQIDGSEYLLAWSAPAQQPGEQYADLTGNLVFPKSDGTLETVLKVPDQANRVTLCGTTPISPDGRHKALFMGVDSANGGWLYVMTDNNEPVIVEGGFESRGYGFQYLGCQGGNGRLRFTPDSQRMIYIAYERDARQSEFADGYMRAISTADYSEQFSRDSVVAFDLNNTFLVFAQFFTDDRNEADEVAVTYWDGTSEREIATFTRESEACKFTSAYIRISPNDEAWMILGERCNKLTWKLYKLDTTAFPGVVNPEPVLTREPVGGMKTFVASNNLFFSPDGSQMYFTLADGVSNDTGALYHVPVDDISENSITQLIERNLRLVAYSEGRVAGENTFPRISPDGKWFAGSVANQNDKSFVYIINLEDPTMPPVVTSAGSTGDTISYLEFTPDSQKLYFIAGGSNEGDDNALFLADFQTSPEPFRLLRGKFSPFARLSPDGNRLAVEEWQVHPEGILGPDWLNFNIIDLTNGGRTTVLVGGVINEDEGRVDEDSLVFVNPIHWWK